MHIDIPSIWKLVCIIPPPRSTSGLIWGYLAFLVVFFLGKGVLGSLFLWVVGMIREVRSRIVIDQKKDGQWSVTHAHENGGVTPRVTWLHIFLCLLIVVINAAIAATSLSLSLAALESSGSASPPYTTSSENSNIDQEAVLWNAVCPGFGLYTARVGSQLQAWLLHSPVIAMPSCSQAQLQHNACSICSFKIMIGCATHRRYPWKTLSNHLVSMPVLIHFSGPQQAQQQQSVCTFALCVHFQVQSLNNCHLGLIITVTTHLSPLVFHHCHPACLIAIAAAAPHLITPTLYT